MTNIKIEKYNEVLRQLPYLLEETNNNTSNYANFSALIHQTFPNNSWTGFYLLQDNELQLGPFQGKVACTKISIGNGVCGTSASKKETIIVPNVHDFVGHIACDENSSSEIVVPLIKDGNLLGVLDVDSYLFNNFDEIDAHYLEQLVQVLLKYIK